MKRLYPLVVAVVVVVSAGCRSSSAPEGAEPSPSFEWPSQAAWSATPSNTAGCGEAPNYWKWNIVVTENEGVGGLTFDTLDSIIDGVPQPRQTLNLKLNGKGKLTIGRAVCLSSSAQHFVEDTLNASYKGSPNISGNATTLLAK